MAETRLKKRTQAGPKNASYGIFSNVEIMCVFCMVRCVSRDGPSDKFTVIFSRKVKTLARKFVRSIKPTYDQTGHPDTTFVRISLSNSKVFKVSKNYIIIIIIINLAEQICFNSPGIIPQEVKFVKL